MPAQSWSTLAVTFSGTRFVVTFDGAPLFEVEDSTFTSAGKVGSVDEGRQRDLLRRLRGHRAMMFRRTSSPPRVGALRSRAVVRRIRKRAGVSTLPDDRRGDCRRRHVGNAHRLAAAPSA